MKRPGLNSSFMNASVAEKKAGMWFILLLLCVTFIIPACGKDQPPSKIPETDQGFSDEDYRKTENEWFWRDRLSIRPEPLPSLDVPLEIRGKVERILARLREQPLADSESAVEELTAVGPSVVDLLAPHIKDEDRTVRLTVVSALGRLGGSRSLEPLCGALYGSWDAASVMASFALEEWAEPWIIPRLIKAIGPYPVDFNPHLMVRVKAACVLLKLGNYSGIPFLIKILKGNTPAQDPDEDWIPTTRLAWEKEEAFKALQAFTGEDFDFSVDATLARQARSAQGFEAWWLARRIEYWSRAPKIEDKLLCAKVNDLIKGLASYQARNADGARYCLKLLGPPVFPFLMEAARKGDFYAKFHSLDLIADLSHLAPDRRAEWALEVADALKDDAPAVRMKAAKALGLLGQEISLPLLEGALNDEDGDVRLTAAGAMGFIGGARACRILEGVLRKDIPAIMAVEVKAALARISPDYIDLFCGELLHEDSQRQEWASQKLIDLTGEDFGFVVGVASEERSLVVERIRDSMAKRPRPEDR